MMREVEIIDKYSVEQIFLQLEKFRKISLADGQIIVTEMTKNRETFSRRLTYAPEHFGRLGRKQRSEGLAEQIAKLEKRDSIQIQRSHFSPIYSYRIC
jgi:hypothetical protein